MDKILELGNQYIRESDWKVIAVLKFCLLSLGVLIGMSIPGKARERIAPVCKAIFIMTYMPLMAKLIYLALRGSGSPRQ